MKDLIEVWRNPKMLFSMILSALVYASLTIPFKDIVLIPSVDEIRPSAFIPVLAGLIFGPAGAWGSAFGNILSDSFGNLSVGSLYGFLGNLILSYMPYKLWFHLYRSSNKNAEIDVRSLKELIKALGCGAIGVLLCAFVIAWGMMWVEGQSFIQVWTYIFFNNLISLVLLIPGLIVLVPLTQEYEINWFSLMQATRRPVSLHQNKLFLRISVDLLILGSLICVALGLYVELASLQDQLNRLLQNIIFMTASVTVFSSLGFALKA